MLFFDMSTTAINNYMESKTGGKPLQISNRTALLLLFLLLNLLFLAAPGILCIANIMLANNICDLEADTRVNRRTLPYYIGTGPALRLFAVNYYIAFAAIILIAVFRILPLYVLFALLIIIAVQKNIRIFKKNHTKAETFHLSVQNLMLIMAALVTVLTAAILAAKE